jgi:two-component system, cell cycle sensor histidine kinase and response regulator CckA
MSAVANDQAPAPGPYVKMTISDNGTGMDEETRQHLFEPFFTTKLPGKGTGLGLSIVSGIVSQLLGDIQVSTQLGEGTTFTICLPATTERRTETPSVRDAIPQRPSPEITVLLVEDDGGVRHLVRKMLLKGGYVVYETSDPHEATRICGTIPIHLLLTDVVMPDTNGIQLAAELVGIREELRVLYMSGYIDDSILPRRSLEPGFHFIRKPFTATRLYRQIEAIFDSGSEELGDRASTVSFVSLTIDLI